MKRASPRQPPLPLSLFIVAPTFAGVALASLYAARLWGHPAWIGHTLLFVAALVLTVLIVLYVYKSLRYQDAAAAELRDPRRVALACGLSIGLLLLASAMVEVHAEMARTLWVAGVVIHTPLVLLALWIWLDGNIAVDELTPVWFMPAVAGVLVPLAGTRFYPPEVSWFFFGSGVMLWLALFPLLLHRLAFRPPLPEPRRFTTFMLIAPLAATFYGYTYLVGFLDTFARVLFYAALFFTAVLLLRSRWLPWRTFSIDWWAASLALATMTLAAMRHFEMSRWPFQGALALVLLALLIAASATLVVLTIRAIARGELRD